MDQEKQTDGQREKELRRAKDYDIGVMVKFCIQVLPSFDSSFVRLHQVKRYESNHRGTTSKSYRAMETGRYGHDDDGCVYIRFTVPPFIASHSVFFIVI